MANINNAGSGRSLAENIRNIAAQAAQAMEGWGQGRNVDLTEKLEDAKKQAGVSQQGYSEPVTEIETEHPLGFGKREARTYTVPATHPLGFGKRENEAPAAATMSTTPVAEDRADHVQTMPHGEVGTEQTRSAGPMLVDSETGEVLQENVNELPESYIDDSSFIFNGTENEEDQEEEQEEEPSQPTRRRRIVGRNSNPWRPRETPVQAPAPTRRPEDSYDAAERVMGNYEQARQFEAEDQDMSVAMGYTRFTRFEQRVFQEHGCPSR